LRHRLHAPRHPSDRYGDFDAWAPSYDRSPLQRLFFDRVHGEVVRAVVALVRGMEAPVVLDVGCGTGRLLERLREALPQASPLGVDASPQMIAVARAKPALAGVRLEVGESESLPLDDASCDVVVSTVSFHHWARQADGLRECRRVLRPGGALLLVDFFARGLLAPVVRRVAAGHGSGVRDEGEVLRMIAGAELRARSLTRVGPPLSPMGILAAARP